MTPFRGGMAGAEVGSGLDVELVLSHLLIKFPLIAFT